MNVIEALLSRKSHRKFLEEAVSDDDIKLIIECGMSAPSAANKHPIHFIIVDDRHLLEILSVGNPNAWMIAKAPCAILVCGDPTSEEEHDKLMAGCAATTQNMLTAVHGLGYGGVWCSVDAQSQRQAHIKEILGIPSSYLPFSFVVMGKPDRTKEAGNRYTIDKVHKNKW